MTREHGAAERRAIHRAGRHVTEILRDHDPLGLIADGAREDEYDCVVAGVIVELLSGRTATLSTWVTRRLADHFGSEPDPQRVLAAAGDIVALWRSEDLAALHS